MTDLLNTLEDTLKKTYEAGRKAGFDEGFKKAVEVTTSIEPENQAIKDELEGERFAENL